MYNEELKQKLIMFLHGKKRIAVVQGDNPDADSLSSSLALEEILHAQDIDSVLLSSIDVPMHLRYMEGWDRTTSELAVDIDGWILVDCEYLSLLDNYKNTGVYDTLLQKPLLILDHHGSPSDIDFAEIVVNDTEAAATGQVIYAIAKLMDWHISQRAAEMMAVSILSDTLGFNSDVMANNPAPLRIMAELVESGVNLGELNERRLARLKVTPDIFRYKAELMKRVEFHYDNSIATIDIPHEEIKGYSMEYNPTVILDETRMIEGVAVTIGLKSYENNGKIFRITARIRCNYGFRIARDLASQFGDGGGHEYAAGFKLEGDDLNFNDVKRDVITKAHELLVEEN